ncbi:hypothetical protein [Inquilinus limosus]|uniref:Uncharacterized protein n=1 Tax=Inquilinus limosus TaxID=171674 RepID=A0A211ZTG8_9PROT|nr:hypothetical protein [Inquilinus limosus]OWJ68578.1 hypothetical protein BWR60_03985 [Inquilinus limosus]
MKIIAIPAALGLSLLAGSCLAGNGAAAPTTADLLETVFRHADTDIRKVPSCESVFATPQGHTLGRYVAEQLSNLSGTGENSVTSSCTPGKGGWSCDVTFLHKDPAQEEVTNYGLRLQVTAAGQLSPDGLSCTGGG